MVPILLGTAHYLCRGGEGKKKGRGQGYFRLARGGLNSFIKKFRGVSSLIASYIFQISKYSFFSLFQLYI